MKIVPVGKRYQLHIYLNNVSNESFDEQLMEVYEDDELDYNHHERNEETASRLLDSFNNHITINMLKDISNECIKRIEKRR